MLDSSNVCKNTAKYNNINTILTSSSERRCNR